MLGERSQAPEDSHWVTRSQEDGHSRGGAEEGGGERLVGAGLQSSGMEGMERSGGWTG